MWLTSCFALQAISWLQCHPSPSLKMLTRRLFLKPVPILHTNLITFCVFDSAVFRTVNLGYHLVGVLLRLLNDRSQKFIGELWTHLDHLVCAIFQCLPFLLCLGLDVRRLSLLNLCIKIISCYLHPRFEIPSDSRENWAEELAWSCDCLFDIVREINLIFFKVWIMFVDDLFNLSLLHSLAQSHQPGSVWKDLLKIVDSWWICK